MPVPIKSFRPDYQGGKQVTCSAVSQVIQVQSAPLNGGGSSRSCMVKNRNDTQAARVEFGDASVAVSATTGYLIMPQSAECIPIGDATHMAYIGDGGGTPILEVHAGDGA